VKRRGWWTGRVDAGGEEGWWVSVECVDTGEGGGGGA